MSSRSSLLACAAILAALLAPASATADDAVAELPTDTPISAYGGALAWSAYDAAAKRFALVIRQGDVTAAARVATARRPFDVSLGPDSSGRVVALYTRCRTATRGCDVYRYDLRTRHERKLASVSSPSIDEAWPAQWRGRIAFARRARTHVVDGYDHRPDPRGRGPVLDCDVPYVKTLSSRAPSRRLDRSHCGATTGLAIRGETIVLVTDINQGGAGSESDVRLLRARGGAARDLARTTGGEGGYSPFVAPNLSGSAVWLTRVGRRQEVDPGFLRIDLATKRLTTIPADVRSFARDERGRMWYVEGPEIDWDAESSCRPPLEPCRLVRASASPFSSTLRTLLPRLSIDGETYPQGREIFAGAALVLSGRLYRAIVRKGRITGTEGVPGVALQVLRTTSIERPGPFAATGRTATTDATGRWAFSLFPPPPDITLMVAAPALKIASILVQRTAFSRILLSASGRALTGTVAPAQPGRTVEIQRFAANAEGRLPNGKDVCGDPPEPSNCFDEAWTTVATAPLGAAGVGFSVTVAGPGEYRARLSSEVDGTGQATAYGGASDLVSVGT